MEGDTASVRDHVHEIGRIRDGRSVVDFALFHDRYRRTPDGWRIAERGYEIKGLDTTPLAGSPHLI